MIYIYIYICVCVYIYIYVYSYLDWLMKNSYDDVISTVDDIFDQRDSSTATLMEKVYGLQESQC